VSQFVVDRDSLLAARAELAVLRDQLLTMHVAIWTYWGQLGGRELEAELEHFCGSWHWGVTEIAARIDSLQARLQQAADAYERIEQRVKHASSEPQSGSAGPSRSGGAPIAPAPHGGHAQRPSSIKHHRPAAKHAPAAPHHSKPRHRRPDHGWGVTVIGGAPGARGDGQTTID
jgi:hypothetical protein